MSERETAFERWMRKTAFERWMETHDDCPCGQDNYTIGDCPEHDSTWQATWGHWCYEQQLVTLPGRVPLCPQCGALNWDRVRFTGQEPKETP